MYFIAEKSDINNIDKFICEQEYYGESDDSMFIKWITTLFTSLLRKKYTILLVDC